MFSFTRFYQLTEHTCSSSKKKPWVYNSLPVSIGIPNLVNNLANLIESACIFTHTIYIHYHVISFALCR